MLPSLADELLRSMPPELRRLFPPLDGGRQADGEVRWPRALSTSARY